jgi:iron complex transport system ATP-binding protein
MRLEAKNLTFAWYGGEPVFRDVSFDFAGRGMLAVLGPNGAGKTTLLKVLLGFLTPSSGEVLWDGRSRADIGRRGFWTKVSYVPQAKAPAQPGMRVAEAVVLGRSARIGAFSQPGAADWAAADRAMEEVGIAALASRRCNELSGGQYQLALIARALCAEPSVLVMDEPESNLDFKNRLMVLRVIRTLSERGLGTVVNTHFPENALALADKALLMPRGGAPVYGDARAVMTEENLSAVFGVRIRVRTLDLPEGPRPAVTASEL